MRVGIYLAIAVAFCSSYALTFVARRIALARGMMDIPNARSSHITPTPRGGGVAIVIGTTLASLVLLATGDISLRLFFALSGGGLAVAVIGLLDDRKPLPAPLRLTVHVISATWGVYVLGGLAPILVGVHQVGLGIGGDILAVLAIVWMLNLFNFMDGIDGIAASEASFIAASGGLLCCLAGVPWPTSGACAATAAASLGFLLWNWPPAKIFMGDVGSGYLGYILALLAIAAARHNGAMLYAWLILGGTFISDATVTLLRRTFSSQRIFDAHRTHAYQWLARRRGAHKPVTLGFLLVNLIWLLPCALLAVEHPDIAPWITLAALTPLAIAAVVIGAGRAEASS